ncbi:MAG: hypothetical protein J7J86_01035 [Bacteroidales bacterium]|nr:hypothetical protein [Bacteroidales bacterium]
MKDLGILVSGIEFKIRKLINLKEKLEKEKKDLINQNQKLIKKNKEQEEIIKQLREKNNILKITKLIKTEGEKDTEVKLRINELVREIDKCLGLLNQ